MDLKEVNKYIGKVADEKVDISRYFVLQCQRHLDDLLHVKDHNWAFDEVEAAKHIRFLTKVARHTKDRWAGKLFGAQPFQVVMFALLFGWHMFSEDTESMVRRFYTLYFDIARKNGKTETVATVANDLFCTGPYGTEIYAAATKRDQAKITFNVAKAQMKFMQRYSAKLRKKINVKTFDMSIPSADGIFEPVSSDHNSLDGLNPLMAIIDEYHAHKTTGVLDVMETAQGARWDGPILAVTTTAGFDKSYPCFAFRQNAIDVLEGRKKDERLLPFIFAMHQDADWKDESQWHLPNPNLGISVSREYLRGQCQKAINEGPSKQRQFQTKNLNLWVDADDVWIEAENWAANSKLSGMEHYKKLYGKKCYGAVDISSVRDLTSIALAFPRQQGVEQPHLIVFHFCPEKRAMEMSKKGYNHQAWARKGWLSITDSNVIDYSAVQQTILDCKKKFKLRELAFDRWGAQHVVAPLMKSGMKFIPHGQGFASMNEPTKAFEVDVHDDEIMIEHFGNPVLAWELNNTAIQIDPAGNIKPDKKNSSGQIDGVVASVMAWGLMKTGENKKSAYAKRGLRTIGY